MSRSASTSEKTQEIFELLSDSNLKAEAYLEVEVDGAWLPVEDLDEGTGIDWQEDRKRYDYANFGLTPVANTIAFRVFNKDGKYSDGSGTAFEGYWDNNTRVRLTAGYKVDDPVTTTINWGNPVHAYFAQKTGGSLVLDSANTQAGTNTHFTDLFYPNYDSVTYDDVPYSANGYAIFALRPGYAVDFDPTTLSVTANTTKASVYWKWVNSLEEIDVLNTTAEWNSAGATVNGTQTYSITDKGLILAVGIVFDGQAWADGDAVSSMSVAYDEYFEWVYRSVFWLDSPTFVDPPYPQLPYIQCEGRDAWKKALETDLNTIDISGDDLDTVIKEVLDRAGIEYNANSIDDLSALGTRTLTGGLANVKSVDGILEYCMQLANRYGETKYVAYLEYDATADENIFYLKPRPSDYSATVAFTYTKYKTLGGLKKNYDKLLQRITVVSDEKVVNERQLLGTLAVTTTGTKTVSWSGAAVYLTYEFSGGTHTATLTDVTSTSVEWSFTAVTGTVTINVYGCKWSSGAPTYYAEWISHTNMLAKGGITHKFTNPLLISTAEAKAVAHGYADDFGSPLYDATDLSFGRLNLMIENNDMAFLWSRNLNLDRLFYVVGINYHWDRNRSPNDSTTFKLYDTGLRFSDVADYEWDQSEIDWDIGYLWDMQFGTLATADTTDYSYLLPVEFT